MGFSRHVRRPTSRAKGQRLSYVYRILYVNICSPQVGFEELVSVIEDYNIDLLNTSESWLTPEVLYDWFGGEVTLFAKQGITFPGG